MPLAPTRARIDPADFAGLLPQVFILGARAPGRIRLRLVGGLVDDLHGGRLGGGDPLKLWAPRLSHRAAARLEAVRRQPEPLVINAEGRARGGQTVALEIALAPLIGASGEIDRMIGLYQPLTPVAALLGQRDRDAGRARHRHRRRGEPSHACKLAAVDGRQIA